jgi:2-isopropylmalate synthase
MKNKNKIYVFDTTLRDGEQASGFHMLPDEKLEIAKGLTELNVDVIEAGFAASSPGDFRAVRKIAEEIDSHTICSLARAVDYDIMDAAEALKPAIKRGNGRIHTFIATSQIHTENKLKKSPDEIKQLASDAVKLAHVYTDDVEFSTEDFGRSNTDYIVDIVETVIKAGATTINLPDTVGYLIPREMYLKTKEVIQRVGERISIDNIIFSCHCHNDLGNATAHTCEAILAGARQIEVTINGIGERAGNTSLEQVIANIKERNKYETNPFTGGKDPFYGLDISHIKTEKIGLISRLVSKYTNNIPQPNFPIVGRNAFAHEAGIHQDGIIKDRNTYEWLDPSDYGVESIITFGPRSGRNALRTKYKSMGINLNEEEFQKAAKNFIEIADQVKEIDDADIVNSATQKKIRETYRLASYGPTISSLIGNTIKLYVDNKIYMEYAEGNGQIDAAIKAIKKIIKKDYQLLDFKITAEYPGSNSSGSTRVVLGNNNWIVIGKSESTDIVTSGISAYVDSCNRMKYIEDYFKD